MSDGMMSVEEALERILARFRVLEAEEQPLLAALGQVLAEDVSAGFNVPPWDNTGMDGYAVQAASTSGASEARPVILRIVGESAAGYVPQMQVGPGEAVRIMTGAPIPAGADSVVPFEETDELEQRAGGRRGSELTEIGVLKAALPDANIRHAGGDVRAGALVLRAGTVAGPAEIGVLATLGLEAVRVIRRPVVAILATGDELLEPGDPLAPGKIYNANAYSLAALVRQAGGIPKLLGIARDTIESLEAKIAAGLDADLFLTSAGVSTGEYDLVKDVLTRSGEMDFWRVRMRPGKPLAFGALRASDAAGGTREVPHLGLPGNPVSSMIAFDQFARPAILKMQGKPAAPRPTVEAVMDATVENSDGRRFFVRTILERSDSGYVARLTGPQGSNVLTSMALANSLAIIPEDWPRVQAGERLRVQVLEGHEGLLT